MAKMEIDTLTVSPRSETGKGPNRRLRAEGLVPGVIYGTGETPIMVSLNFRELEKALAKPNAETNLFKLAGDSSVAGNNVTTVLREIQRDPLSRRFLHVDLMRVRMDQAADFEVPIHPTGTPIGVREGGVMETHLRIITVSCLPADLPEEILVDIKHLKTGETLHVRDVQLPSTLTLVTEPDETLFAVHGARAAEVTTDGEAPAQPEVIGKPAEEAK